MLKLDQSGVTLAQILEVRFEMVWGAVVGWWVGGGDIDDSKARQVDKKLEALAVLLMKPTIVSC